MLAEKPGVRAAEHLAGQLEFVRPRGGMFMWCRMHAAIDARDLLERASKEGVFFVPGVAFYPGRPDLATFRLSFATMPVERIHEGIERLARVLPG